MNLYPLARTLSHIFVWLLFRLRYEGLENIPKEQGFILASNHRTNFDPLFISHKVPQQLYFMGKAELFHNPILRWILLHVNAFPIERGSGDTGAIRQAGEIIRKGGILAMFPEGHRSRDGKPQRARAGVALIAGQTNADILPCCVAYGKRLGFRTVVTIRYGKLLTSEELGIAPDAPASVRVASKKIMASIVDLLAMEGCA